MDATRVLMATAEAAPFAVDGELAQVMGSLPVYLKRLGCNLRVILPYYSSVLRFRPSPPQALGEISFEFNGRIERAEIRSAEHQGILFYFVRRDDLFEREGLYHYRADDGSYRDHEDNLYRFAFFSRAVLESGSLTGFHPDVIHAAAWQTALIPAYLKNLSGLPASLEKVKTLLTLPNLAFQGLFPPEQFEATGLPSELFKTEGLEYYGMINVLKGGILFADRLNTVSPSYAASIQTGGDGCGLEGVLASRSRDLSGIMDGIDSRTWDPAGDPVLGENRYDHRSLAKKAKFKDKMLERFGIETRPGMAVLCFVSRLEAQKGFSLLEQARQALMERNLALVIAGSGTHRCAEFARRLVEQFPRRVVFFEESLASPRVHEVIAAADILLIPSEYEPCGLWQLVGLRYGTLPLAMKTGGLADSIKDGETGFLFEDYRSEAFLKSLDRALDCFGRARVWQKMQIRAMKEDWSWDNSARQYQKLYRKLARGG